MGHRIRPATIDDIARLVAHREGMFREMGVPCDFDRMAPSYARWLRQAIPGGTYRGWVVDAEGQGVVAGAGLIVMPWSPGPLVMDPRMAFVFNVYTAPAQRGQGLARRLMDTLHAWCRAEGIERLALNASAAGLPLYESMGYAPYAEPMMRLSLA